VVDIRHFYSTRRVAGKSASALDAGIVRREIETAAGGLLGRVGSLAGS
jgi:hypothetical protein